jgi:hypothetical protein
LINAHRRTDVTKLIGAFRDFPNALVGCSVDWNVERVLR